MNLSKTLVTTALVVSAAVVTIEAEGVTLQVDQVKQRYPWNGLIDIDYTVSGDDVATLGLDDSLEVMMIDRSVTPAVTNRANCFLQAPLPIAAGQHRITWDANYDGVTNRLENAEFDLQIVHYSASYAVIDVSGGSSAATYPVDFLNGAPAGGFNVNEYKGNKIVLRRIRPGSYVAGSPSNEPNQGQFETQHRVAHSRPFYIGIFEITQKQYANVKGADPSTNKGDFRPVEKVSFDAFRGQVNTTTHQYEWPATKEVDPASFFGLLRAKCRAKDGSGNYTVVLDGFDMPTEYQWEYACRAGTTGGVSTTNAYNNANSNELQAQIKLVCRYNGNIDERGGYAVAHTTVGSYLPNPWGLYDMQGNVWEWVLDNYTGQDPTILKQYVDPKGSEGAGWRALRGGSHKADWWKCRSGFHQMCYATNVPADDVGTRIVLNAQ